MRKKVLLILGLLILINTSVFWTSCTSIPVSPSLKNNDTTSTKEDLGEHLYNIGETAILKDWKINVTDVQIIDSVNLDYIHYSPNEGNKYLQITLTVTNLGTQADTFLPSFQYGSSVKSKVYYKKDYEFSASNLLGYKYDIHDSHINPLSSNTGEIVFEISEAVVNSTDGLTLEFISGKDTVQFKLR